MKLAQWLTQIRESKVPPLFPSLVCCVYGNIYLVGCCPSQLVAAVIILISRI